VQWLPIDDALRELSYDNARGVLRRGSDMARTLIAAGAGRPAAPPRPISSPSDPS
jgi:hypothetical protein